MGRSKAEKKQILASAEAVLDAPNLDGALVAMERLEQQLLRRVQLRVGAPVASMLEDILVTTISEYAREDGRYGNRGRNYYWRDEEGNFLKGHNHCEGTPCDELRVQDSIEFRIGKQWFAINVMVEPIDEPYYNDDEDTRLDPETGARR